MKLLKYNSIKLTIFSSIVYGIFYSLVMYSISWLVTDNINALIENIKYIAIIILFWIGSLFLNQYIKSFAIYNVSMDIQQKISKGLIDTNYEKFLKTESGEYVSFYTNDTNEIIEKHVKKFLDFWDILFSVIFLTIAIIKIHYIVFIISIISFLVSVVIPKIFEKRYTAIITKTQEIKGQFLNKIRELIQGFSTFKENDSFDTFIKKTRLATNKTNEQNKKRDIFESFMTTSINFTNITMLMCSIAMLSILVIKNYINYGDLLASTTLISNLSASVLQAMTAMTAYKASGNFVKDRLNIILNDNYEETTFTKNFFTPKNILNTSLTYKNNYTNINSISTKNLKLNFGEKEITIGNLIFEKGKKYAVIGESGCGKSTLLKTIVGEISNYNGEIIINGHSKEKNKSLFSSISYVSQNTYLFNDSVKENITMGKESSGVEIDNILSLLKLTDIDKNYILTENGKNLSGGQRQRISLARALFRNTDIIFMDEATSALDKETRLAVENYILSLDKTIIMISHNLDNEIKEKLDTIYTLT